MCESDICFTIPPRDNINKKWDNWNDRQTKKVPTKPKIQSQAQRCSCFCIDTHESGGGSTLLEAYIVGSVSQIKSVTDTRVCMFYFRKKFTQNVVSVRPSFEKRFQPKELRCDEMMFLNSYPWFRSMGGLPMILTGFTSHPLEPPPTPCLPALPWSIDGSYRIEIR